MRSGIYCFYLYEIERGNKRKKLQEEVRPAGIGVDAVTNAFVAACVQIMAKRMEWLGIDGIKMEKETMYA